MLVKSVFLLQRYMFTLRVKSVLLLQRYMFTLRVKSVLLLQRYMFTLRVKSVLLQRYIFTLLVKSVLLLLSQRDFASSRARVAHHASRRDTRGRRRSRRRHPDEPRSERTCARRDAETGSGGRAGGAAEISVS